MVYWLDRRRSRKRFQAVVQGQIVLGEDHVPVECFVTDLSETGARIEVSEPLTASAEFDLVIPERLTVRARTAWTRGREHGLVFLTEMSGPLNPLVPQQGEPTAAKPSYLAEFVVQEALDEARQRISDAIGIPVEAIHLTIEIGPQDPSHPSL